MNFGAIKCGSIIFAMLINSLLQSAPKLKYIGISATYLSINKTTCAEILSYVNNKNLILKTYKGFSAMIKGHSIGSREQKFPEIFDIKSRHSIYFDD